MPQYLFHHPDDETNIIEVVQTINEEHVLKKDGVWWVRLYTIPNMAVDSIVDPYDAQSFVNATHKKGTIGDIMDRSKEMSQKRADKEGGLDPIKEKFYENYSKTRKGLVHPDVTKRKSKERIRKLGFTLE